ncbi:TraM recognition domain-containing protein, partial [Thermogemmatispora sp.]|uniref:TraM recognition domain-containing protein n=1 Tax=Thermogemmatispora sp. TaxID=1968838 RepID=UPI0035E42BE8
LPRDPGCRVVAQLVLAPAGNRWLQRQRRRIEQLRRERAGAQSHAHGGMTLLMVLALSLLGLAFWSAPSRLLTVGTGLQPGLLAALGVSALLLLFQGWVSWQRHRELDLLWLDREPLRQQAFRVQLRLLAINSLPEDPSPGSPQGGWRRWWQRWQQAHQAAVNRRAALSQLLAAYRQFEWLGATVRPHRIPPWQLRRLLRPGGWRGPRLRWYAWDLLPVSTVGALWHVPAQMRAEISPLLTRHSHRIMPVGPALASRPGRLVARAFLGQESVSVPWPSEILAGHLLVVGRSGEGKSTALLQLALEALSQNQGLILIDPHDLVDQLLPLIPPQRGDEVILLDLSDPDAVPGINPLDVHFSPVRDKAVADLLACFREIWATSWGPRMEAACEAALKLIYSVNQQLVTEGDERQLTLLEVLLVLSSDRVRNRLLRLLHRPDPFLIRWWQIYFEPLSLFMRLERVDPVLTKFAKFEAVTPRRILGQSRSSVHVRQCLQRVLLIKLAPGVVGEDIARLIGATLLNLLGLFLQEQPAGRRRTMIIVDEFQFFLGVRWQMLAELRKYGANFALATQSLDAFRHTWQERKLLAQIFSNIQSLLAFAGSADDAQTLAPELGITAEDLQSLPRHHCYARLPVAGERITCSLQLLLPDAADPALAERIRATSRERFCRPVQEIDRELAERQQWLLLGAEGTRVARAPSGAEDPVAGEPAQEPEGDSAGGTLVRDSLAAGEGREEAPAPSHSRGGPKRGRKGLRKRTEAGSFRPVHRQGQVRP